MITTHIINIDDTFYEVTLRGNLILSITRSMGELRRPVTFDNLSPSVQHKLLDELILPSTHNDNGTKTT